MENRTTEVGVQCHKCGAIRNKKCKPWKVCTRCKNVFCLRCMNGNNTVTTCWECWNEEYTEKEQQRLSTPVECSACHQSKLPTEMRDPYATVKVCKSCNDIAEKVRQVELRAQESRLRKRPGLVEVIFGRHPKPEKEGSGYAYHCDEPVAIGDIVLVPATWLDEVHQDYGSKEATVVSTSSAYEGTMSHVIRVVERTPTNEQTT